MKRKRALLGALCLLLCATLVGSATAQSDGPEAPDAAVSAAFTYQGQIKRNGALFTGICDLQFKLWNAASGGGQIGSTLPANAVSVNTGVFAVSLDFGNLFAGQARWIEVAAKCADDAGFTTLPRVALNATPYAIGLMPGALIEGDIPYGLGSATIKATNSSASNGIALFGRATATSGTTAGVYGLADSAAGSGVWGKSVNSTGVLGESTYGAGMSGRSAVGTGVAGDSVAWVGVYGESDDNAGVWGDSTFGYGVYGESDDQDAIHGLSHEPGRAGVAGRNDAAGGIGVYGIAPGGAAARFDGQTLIQAPGDTLPLVVKKDTTESSAPDLALFQTAVGDLGALSANTGAFILGAAEGKALGFNVNNGARAVTIGSDGNVGIGTSIIGARLAVRGPTVNSSATAFRVEDVNGGHSFSVDDNGLVAFGDFDISTANALCYATVFSDMYRLSQCYSAAEYVPTIDRGAGFPETADLVSIALDVPNPYGDDHSPFVVTQSTKPCDPSLLGYIVNPESGASGEKVNEHYLPLAIYGYFPAKVTTENGAIRRGDALTSSSKLGHAMKATQACKIIGYALEDADQDGTIQVFANLGESAAPEVAELRAQVEDQNQTIADLQAENAALDARLTALEQGQGGHDAAQNAIPSQAVLVGALVIAGLVAVRRADRNASK